MSSVIATIAMLADTPAAGSESLKVKLAIVHDGRDVPLPEQLKIGAAGKTIEVAIVNGTFAIPADEIPAEHSDVTIELEGEEIRILGLHRTMFEMNEWSLMLADHRYPDGYQREMRPWVKVRRTCILKLDSPDALGLIEVVNKCRTKLGK